MDIKKTIIRLDGAVTSLSMLIQTFSALDTAMSSGDSVVGNDALYHPVQELNRIAENMDALVKDLIKQIKQ